MIKKNKKSSCSGLKKKKIVMRFKTTTKKENRRNCEPLNFSISLYFMSATFEIEMHVTDLSLATDFEAIHFNCQ